MKETKLSLVMRKIRVSRNLLARDIAMALGISPSYLSLIEQGKRVVRENFITDLNKFLNFSIPEQTELLEAIEENQNKFVIQEDTLTKIKREIFELLSQTFAQLKSNLVEMTAIKEIEGLIEQLKKFMEGLANRNQPQFI